jgi:dihydroxy-acid dehydratase
MVNAHCADALICISNCDKITPGMLIAAMRLNIPTVFVSGGPMEAGAPRRPGRAGRSGAQAGPDRLDGRRRGSFGVRRGELLAMEEAACPTCGSCSGMFTANSMNCLTEAIGLALPGNGTRWPRTRPGAGCSSGRAGWIVEITRQYYADDDESVLPRSIASRDAFENAMALDVAMGGSTNTILHLLAAAHEARRRLRAQGDRRAVPPGAVPVQGRAEQAYHLEDVHRAGGIPSILGELDRAGLLNRGVHTVHRRRCGSSSTPGTWGRRRCCRRRSSCTTRRPAGSAPPGGTRSRRAGTPWTPTGPAAASGTSAHAYTADGGLAVLYGNLGPDGAVVKTAGVPEELWTFSGPAVVFESQEDAVAGILGGAVRRATWSSSATRARAAGPACRRCCTRPAS